MIRRNPFSPKILITVTGKPRISRSDGFPFDLSPFKRVSRSFFLNLERFDNSKINSNECIELQSNPRTARVKITERTLEETRWKALTRMKIHWNYVKYVGVKITTGK